MKSPIYDKILKHKKLDQRGIDPLASHMRSERSTTWATDPRWYGMEGEGYKGLNDISLQNADSIWKISELEVEVERKVKSNIVWPDLS